MPISLGRREEGSTEFGEGSQFSQLILKDNLWNISQMKKQRLRKLLEPMFLLSSWECIAWSCLQLGVACENSVDIKRKSCGPPLAQAHPVWLGLHQSLSNLGSDLVRWKSPWVLRPERIAPPSPCPAQNCDLNGK